MKKIEKIDIETMPKKTKKNKDGKARINKHNNHTIAWNILVEN